MIIFHLVSILKFILKMKCIIYIWYLTLFTTIFLNVVENKRNSHKLEYMIQIPTEWIDTIKLESPRFGLRFKRTLVSNILLFEGELYPSEGVAVDVKAFKGFFAEKIVHIEKRERGVVRYHVTENKTSEADKTWILRRRKNIPEGDQCWPYYGMAIQEAWSLGYTGLGVVVAVVDIGVETNHPDLKHNIAKNLSYSFVDRNHSHVHPKRFRNYIRTEKVTSHGTMAAGLIAAEFGNKVCSSGVAFKSKIAALNVFSPAWKAEIWIQLGYTLPVTHIPAAMAYKNDDIDIYSCSFNQAHKFLPTSVEMTSALKDGVSKGRKGKGNIYVVSAGNKIDPIYDCNMEPLAISIYTITISSVGKNGSTPNHAIPCAATLASTYGEFKTLRGHGKLTTTTHDGKCGDFKGTSASTALASGIFALTLQANPNITWRDLQHIIVLTATHERLGNADRRQINAAGHSYDSFFGFGLMDAADMTVKAKTWQNVPPQKQKTVHGSQGKLRLTKEGVMLAYIQVEPSDSEDDCVKYLEQVKIKLKYKKRLEAFIEIILCSPLGTCSCLLSRKPHLSKNNHQQGWRNWNFTSVHFWGENPTGSWTLVFNKSHTLTQQHFEVKSVVLTLYGTSINPSEACYNETKNETYKKYDSSTSSYLMNNLDRTHQTETSFDDSNDNEKAWNKEDTSFLIMHSKSIILIIIVAAIVIIIISSICWYCR